MPAWMSRIPSGSDHVLTRGLFLRLLAVVYLVAFLSLWAQVHGLVGEHGIWPAARYLDAAREQLGPERLWKIPTLLWLASGDAALDVLCGGGVVLAGLLLFGVAPLLCLVLLWTFYLSLVSAGGVFLSFQWDTLLLETGLLACLLAPVRLLPRAEPKPHPPSFAAVLSLRWLLFKLMFLSGLVKLTSGDPAWRDLTALAVHYETQPLPAWTSWWMHQAPLWFSRASCLGMFVVELAVPLFIFAPRRLRMVAFAGLLGFQGLIAATGNYGFFNLNTAVLCVMLLDDRALSRILPGRLRARCPEGTARETRRRPWVVLASASGLFLLSAVAFSGEIAGYRRLPKSFLRIAEEIAPFRSINGYGLFRVMTTERLEIEIEGSRDGIAWEPYGFRWKPGDPGRRPGFVAPHMPRLDWQMWFAALGTRERNPWLLRCLRKLLEGEPEVLSLFGTNPFPGEPPRFVRARIRRYRFTGPAARRETGAWWELGPPALYAPVLTRSGS